MTRREQVFNMQERINMYAGSLICALAPIALLRYVCLPESDNFVQESFYWITSAVGTSFVSIPGALFGYIGGRLCAFELRDKRMSKERASNLENKTQKERS